MRLAAPPPMDAIAPRPEEFSSHEDAVDDVELSLPSIGEVPATVAMSEAEKAALSKRLERLAADSREAHRREVSWQQDGRQYSAVLVREQASDGSALEQVIADVSTSDRGKNLTTRVNLRRLAFSQFTQMVDTWDPMVQLHDDEIVGRFHSNSQLKLLHDASTAPRFSGKVTTAARGFDLETRTRRPNADLFKGASRRARAASRCRRRCSPSSGRRRTSTRACTSSRATRTCASSATAASPGSARHSGDAVREPSLPSIPVYLVATDGATLYVQGTCRAGCSSTRRTRS